MRVLVVVGLLCATARADDAVRAQADADDDQVAVVGGVAVGAGGQGAASYGALELRLDAEWRGQRLGLAARGVWEDGVFRRRDWARAADAVTVVRYLELHSEHAALAAGALAPSQLGHVADGYRASLDDRLRTGARASVTTTDVTAGAEIDDVLSPALVGAAVAWEVAPPWGVRAATAIDPTAPGGTTSAFELGGSRRWDAPGRRLELGTSVIVERGVEHVDPTDTNARAGVTAVAGGAIELERGGARWSARADVRAGNGTGGAAFGPLYRLERADLWERTHAGAGGGITVGVAAERGWVTAGARVRPGTGALLTVGGGAPMGRFVQAGAWLAATPRAAAGAAELRVAWARRISSALQLARMYATDAMDPLPRWSATVWFGVATE